MTYEADPRQHELIAKSVGHEAGTPVLTPAVKPSQPEELTFKGDEHAINGQVMDITGRVSMASAEPTGVVTITDSDVDVTP